MFSFRLAFRPKSRARDLRSARSLGEYLTIKLELLPPLEAFVLRSVILCSLAAFCWQQIDTARGPAAGLPVVEENAIPLQASVITRVMSSAYFGVRQILLFFAAWPQTFADW